MQMHRVVRGYAPQGKERKDLRIARGKEFLIRSIVANHWTPEDWAEAAETFGKLHGLQHDHLVSCLPIAAN